MPLRQALSSVKGEFIMKEPKFLFCKHCKNLVMVVFDSKVPVHCCGEPMVELKAGTTDAALEKHVPALKREGNKLFVQVGSVAHPMTEEHWIVFVAAVQGEKVQIQYLNPGEEPKAEFDLADGPVAVYEYCNLHGLWKAEA